METKDMVKIWNIIRKWWWIIVALLVTTVGTMLSILLLAETQYMATAAIQISAPPPQEVPLYSTFGRQALQDEILQTQASLRVLLLEGDVAYRTLQNLPEIPMGGSELRQRIVVDIPENSQLMRVSVKAPNPELAALLTNAVVENGLAQYAELAARSTTGMRKFIEQQLDVAQEEYGKAETQLTQFQVTNKIGSLSTAIDEQYNLIETLKTQRDLAQADGDVARSQTLDEIILDREAELQNLIGLSSEYYTLVGRVDRARDTYNFMLDKKAEAQIKENQILELGSIQIITPARPPSQPATPLNGKLIALGAIVSVIAGVLLALLLEYMEVSGVFQRFRSFGESPLGEAPVVRETLEETG